MAFDGKANPFRSDRRVLVDRQTQRILHGVLTVAGRQLQNLQVFASRHTRAMSAKQCIVGDAKMARRKHVCMILVVLEGARLANQRVNHMPIIDGMLAAAGQTRHRLNLASRSPDLDRISVDHNIDPHADQPTGNRIRVALDLNRATAADLDSADAMPVIELARRQLAENQLLLGELVGAGRVSLVDQRHEKLFVFRAAGEVAIATQ